MNTNQKIQITNLFLYKYKYASFQTASYRQERCNNCQVSSGECKLIGENLCGRGYFVEASND